MQGVQINATSLYYPLNFSQFDITFDEVVCFKLTEPVV